MLSKRKGILKLKITSKTILTQSLMLSYYLMLSLNSAVISFNLEKQNLFSQGRMYVALSCVADIKLLPSFLELVLTNTSNLSTENFVNLQFRKSVLFVWDSFSNQYCLRNYLDLNYSTIYYWKSMFLYFKVLCTISPEPYIWLSFMVHMCKMIISAGVFLFLFFSFF